MISEQKDNTTIDDSSILKMFADKKQTDIAFRHLVDKYKERLYWHIRKIVIGHEDTDDVLQNTFIKVWSALNDFKGNSALYTWLYRIATNEALAFLKKKRTKLFLPLIDVEKQLEGTLETDPYFCGNKVEKEFQKALLKLPEKQRIVFNMKYFEEMKYEEISEILSTSVGALKASYHHAVKKIEKFITNN